MSETPNSSQLLGQDPSGATGQQSQNLDGAVRKAFISGIGSKVCVIIFGVVALGLAARALDVTSFGIVATLAGLLGIFGFMDFGIGNGLIYRLAVMYAKGDYEGIRSALANSLAFLAGIAIVLSAAMIFVIWQVPDTWLFGAEASSSVEIRTALTVFSFSAAIAIPCTVGSRLALGIQRGYLNNFTNLAGAALSVLGVFVGFILDLDIIYFVLCFVLPPALAGLAQTCWLLTSGKGIYSPAWSMMSRPQLGALLLQGLPFMALALAGAATYQAGSLIVIYIVGPAGAGVFGLLVKVFIGMTVLFAGGLQQLWASTAHALARGDLAWVRRSFSRVLLITSALFAIAALAVVILGRYALEVWAGASAVPSFELLLAFAIWYSYSFVMGQASMLLNGANIVWVQAICAILMTITSIPLSIYLTQQMGLPGPLYGNLISHVVCVGIPTVTLALRLLSGRSVGGVRAQTLPA